MYCADDATHLLHNHGIADEEAVLVELGVIRVLISQIREAHGHVKHHALLHRRVVLGADDQRALAELDTGHKPGAEGAASSDIAGQHSSDKRANGGGH